MNRDAHNAIVHQMNTLLRKAEEEGRAFSDEEKSQWMMLRERANLLDEAPDLAPQNPRVRIVGEIAKAVSEGLANSSNVRANIAATLRSLSSNAGGALGDTQYPVVPNDFGIVQGYAPPVARLIDFLPTLPVDSNSATFVRVNFGDANSPSIGNSAAVVKELARKPESGVGVTPVTITIDTIAHWCGPISQQVLADVVGLRATIDQILIGGLLDAVDATVYAGFTTGGNHTDFTHGGSETIGDGIARSAAQVANAGGRNIVVAVNPDDFLTAQLLKASDSGMYLGFPPNLASRVVAVPTVTKGKVIAWDAGAGAAWADRQGVSVIAGLAGDDFLENAIRILAECRGALCVRNPNLVAYGDIS